MKFYKRNPEIKHSCTVQSVEMGEDTIVCGEEFAPFANPGTFPGRPPKLVVVPFEDLTDEQRIQVKGFADVQAKRPPKHIGIITSDAIHSPTIGESKVKISGVSEPDVTVERKAKIAELEPIETPEVRGPEKNDDLGRTRYGKGMTVEQEAIEVLTGDKIPSLGEMYTVEEMIDTFPGVTDKNVSSVMDSFSDLEVLSTAANAELRRAGMPPNYFGRVRARAIAEKKAYEDSK